MSDAQNFLRYLWADKPSEYAIQLWRKADHKSYYRPTVDSSVDWINNNGDSDIYMAAGLAGSVQSPNKRRTTNQAVVAIAGVWADIDVNGGPDGKSGVAHSWEEAQNLAEYLMQPTLLVHSGYGLQAWWLFETVWCFADSDERDHAQKVVQGFQGALKSEAKKRGYTIDSTFDLARLMRVPGGFNHKGTSPQEVTLFDDGGPRYSVEQVEDVGREFQTEAHNRVKLMSGDGVEVIVDPKAQPPFDKFSMAIEVSDEFKAAWEHRAKGGDHGDLSRWDLTLANYMAGMAWTPQEMVDTLIAFRRKYDPQDSKGKFKHTAYYKQTIGKALATAHYDKETAFAEADREEAETQLAISSNDAGLNPDATVSLFNRVVRGPKIKNLMQYGTDHDNTRYVIILEDGRDIQLGRVENLLQLQKFSEHFVTKTGHLCQADNKNWKRAVQALIKTATVIEHEDDTRGNRSLVQILKYANPSKSNDRDSAAREGDPFEYGDYLHVHSGSFTFWLQRQGGEARTKEADAQQMLMAAGFEKMTVLNYNKPDGKGTTKRGYFRIPLDQIGDQ